MTCSAIRGLLDKDDDPIASHELLKDDDPIASHELLNPKSFL